LPAKPDERVLTEEPGALDDDELLL
jgi:hypothetical protein